MPSTCRCRWASDAGCIPGADAEDALQESYLAAYRAIGSFRGESSLATWLSRLVLNHCLGRRRRELRRDSIVAIVPESPASEAAAGLEPDFETPDRALVRS